ncbi:serine protease [Streptomyces cinnamoneus]|uniref:Serine protease n=2 Tax=Streptomyces cinnamoneus TaxID=53446 RepID=A0A2G1XB27_STRCJ|nr:serine protease [Streptomyces cinnamoneus]PPT12560.1 S1 family peptidase [Streptomyces cinnamoneus]
MPARAVRAATAVVALAAVALVPVRAGASSGRPAAVLSAPSAARLATSLAAELKGAAAGSYYDGRTGALVVNVLGPAAEDAVRAAGAEPRRVRFSQARLDAARRVLGSRAAIPGTAWVADPRANRVVVTADPTVTGARMARLTEVTESLGDVVVVRRTATRLTRLLAGGDAIWGRTARCSLGFNVTKGGEAYFLTAGHCGKAVPNWSDSRDGREVAVTVASVFPGRDHALARYTAGTDHPGAVTGGGAITRAGRAAVGQAVSRSGSTTGTHHGRVTGLDATVNYAEGRVDGLIKADVCAEAGDSGGPLYDGDTALGLTSGGSGDCTTGGETYYQPVEDALRTYGVRVG